MENKNPIDKKIDDVTNVITTSKTVYQFLNLIWILLLFVGVYLFIGTIFNTIKEGFDTLNFVLGTLTFILARYLIRVTTNKISSLK